MSEFSNEQIERYSRNMVLNEIGITGQRKINKVKVLVIGAGGLGSPVLMYLAAAGVGDIGIIDGDKIELSNLQRQTIHATENIGMSKVQSAKKFIKRLNTDVKVTTYEYFLNKDNSQEIISKYDLIIDGVDNFQSRYLVNDTCVYLKKPLVEAGIIGFVGMVTLILSDDGPCYRCLYPEIPDRAPTCSKAGVLGATAGIIGSIQASEAIKYIVGIEENLNGRVIFWDGLTSTIHEVKLHRNKDCLSSSPKRK
ncbi:MAG: adenylyltransferase [Peptococcaceae bacterium BICA1-8]|nr:MAG: adenylyltransferase [Peptococcaceae bacterium BICA1-8]